MSQTYRAWQAGMVRRWHTNFDLCDTVDYDAGHQGRVCILILKLFPNASRALLVRAVTHDQGEVAAGDVSFDAKRANPCFGSMAAALETAEIERQGLPQPDLRPDEAMALKVCDWLDAWLWMVRFAPHLASRADWSAQFAATALMAERLGVLPCVTMLAEAAIARHAEAGLQRVGAALWAHDAVFGGGGAADAVRPSGGAVAGVGE